MTRTLIALAIGAAALSTGCATTAPTPYRATAATGPTPTQCFQAHAAAQASARAMRAALPACERNVGINDACYRVVILARIGQEDMALSGRCMDLMMPPPNIAEAQPLFEGLGPRVQRVANKLDAL